MRKKISAIILVCLIALLTCSLVACNADGSKYVNSVPTEIGANVDSEGNQTTEINGGYASVKFSFTTEMSSVFNTVVVDPNEGYDVTTINYQVIYTKDAITTVSADIPLQMDYIDEVDKPLLYQKGHHTIHVSIPYGGTILKSSFALHLRYAYDEIEYKTLTFYTNGGTPHFATATNNIVSINVENGLTFTYDEFIRNFTITKEGQAIQYFAVEGNSIKRLQRDIPSGTASTTSNKITISGDTKFTVNWTANTVNVKFTIVAPKDEKGNTVPVATDDNGNPVTVPTIANQYVEMSVGTISRPLVDVNVYNGYYFAGWFDKATDRVWNFTTPVGEDNIELYTKWTNRYYSKSIYTMGGKFKDNISDSVVDGVELQSLDVAKKKGFLVAESIVSFSATTGYPLRIDVSGLTYGAKFSDYVVELQLDANDSTKTAILVLSEFLQVLEKPVDSDLLEGKIVIDNKLYKSLSCKDEEAILGTDSIDANSTVLYAKWLLNAKESDQDYGEIVSEFFAKVLFKDSIQLKSDGSVMITDVVDQTFSEIVVPDAIYFEGQYRYISEFSSKSIMNDRSLGLLDLSKASHLEIIGSEAFVNCNNLYKIVWPTNNNIKSIGKKAFTNTNWENNFDSDFIIINGILYKYLDKSTDNNKIKSIDLSNYYSEIDGVMDQETADKLNAELNGVKVIAEEAFNSGIHLEEVILPASVEEISKNAFAGIDNLRYVEAGSALYKVSATAFDETQLIAANYTTDTTKKNNTVIMKTYSDEDVEVVKVGNVIVRVLDTNIENITIRTADGITAFAEEAFLNCKELNNILFIGLTDSNIKYVGANALSSATKYINKSEKNGFTIINGILTEYYNINYYDYNVTIPTTVKVIGEYAFNSYARYIQTVEIGANVEEILNYAFAGATNIQSLLLSNVQLVSDRLINLPKINALSFANSNGELINGINFYFYNTVYTYLSSLTSTKMDEIYAAAIANSDAYVKASALAYYETLNDWYNLFNKNKNNFKVEKIEKVYVNKEVVDSLYVISGTTHWVNIDNGIVLQTSAGVKKYDQLKGGTNTFTQDLVCSEGSHKAQIKAKSDWGDAICEEFEYKVVYAVKGSAYPFYDSKNKSTIINGNALTSSGSMWVTGFEGDILGAEYPTFYTSKTSIDVETIVLNYKTDMDSETHKVVASEYSDFSPNANITSTIYFMFDFNGAGYYRISFNYKGVESKVEKIEQANPISIPLNANVLEALNKSTVLYTGEDKSVTEEYIDMNEFDVYSVNGNTEVLSLISNTLGLNTIELKYRGSKKVSSSLANITIVYSVVLEGDASQFIFELKSGGAVITGHRNNQIETLVIPSTYVKNGVEYDVVEIAANVFSGYSKLTTVYLPSTIKKILNGAFKNCAQLKNVYSSSSTENTKTHIADANFNIKSKDITEYGTINVSSVDLTTGTIVVPSTLVIESSSVEGTSPNEIPVNTTSYVAPIFGAKTFEQFYGTIYFDYTEINLQYVKDYIIDSRENTINGIEVVFMFTSSQQASSLNTASLQFLQYTEANKTFINGQKNPKNDLGEDVDMEVNYLFYYVISDTQVRKTSTTQRHFTYDETSIVISRKEVYQTRELKSLLLENTSIDTIVVGDIYEKEETVKGVVTVTTSKTVAVASEIVVNKESFVVYLPDTIFNTTTIKNNSAQAQQVIIYKHGEELLYSTNNYVSASIQYIGNGVFESCVSLENIDLTKATELEDIGSAAFSKSGIEAIDLSNTKVKEINSQAFQDCVSLETVALSSTTTYIGAYAFDGCTSLTLTKEFFANIKNIAEDAFTRCDALLTIDLTASSIDTIGVNAFSNSNATVKVSFKAGNKPAGWNNAWNGFCTVIYAA